MHGDMHDIMHAIRGKKREGMLYLPGGMLRSLELERGIHFEFDKHKHHSLHQY
jgi:hypothetical protein